MAVFSRIYIYVKSILAVIYVNKNKFQKLINRPEMNCSMSIPRISISQIISFLIFQAVV